MEEAQGHTAVLGQWLERLKQGDNAARNEVIQHACQRLEVLTRRMLRHYPRLRRWEQTDDVLQNALLRLHRSLATIQPGSPRQFYGLAATHIRRELVDLFIRHHFGPEGAAAKHHTDRHGSRKVAPSPTRKTAPGSRPRWRNGQISTRK